MRDTLLVQQTGGCIKTKDWQVFQHSIVRRCDADVGGVLLLLVNYW